VTGFDALNLRRAPTIGSFVPTRTTIPSIEPFGFGLCWGSPCANWNSRMATAIVVSFKMGLRTRFKQTPEEACSYGTPTGRPTVIFPFESKSPVPSEFEKQL